MYNPLAQLPPGFRFHPTDEELIVHYLMNRKASPSPSPPIIAEVDIYKFDPWDLPKKALFGDREWYFFSPRERKYPNGVRPNRAAVSGYWKATGTDKEIRSGENNVGVKKALVFYKGKPPKGCKSNWIMHEYRLLAESQNSNKYKAMSSRGIDHSTRQLDDWVLCRIYKKSKHLPPPLTDPEVLENSSADDACFPTQTLSHHHHQLPKTLSISEYLENFSQISSPHCNPLDLPAYDKTPLFGHPIINHDNNAANAFFLPQLSQIESSDSFNLKLQQDDARIIKEETGGAQNFAEQFDSSQYSLLNQPFFSHQLLLNSHLGFQ